MYKLFVRPLIFWININKARRLILLWLFIIGRVPIIRALTKSRYSTAYPELERDVFGVKFRNPIGLAAGFDINGDAIEGLQNLGMGFVEIGTITAEEQSGNPSPNTFLLPKDRAVIYRTGYPNKGWNYAINNLRRQRKGIVVGCNISRNTNTLYTNAGKEILKSFRNLYQYTDYFTVSLNYNQITYGDNVSLAEELTKILTPLFEFRRGQSEYRPIMLKVTPDLDNSQLDSVVEVLVSSPLDGVVATTGTESHEGLVTPERVVENIGMGRVSGAPLRKRSLEVVRYIYERSGGAYPIIGAGGVSSAEQVEEMLAAGASLVQIYSAFIYEGPSLARRLCRDLANRHEQEEKKELQNQKE